MSLLGKLMDTMRLNPEEEGEDTTWTMTLKMKLPEKDFFQREIIQNRKMSQMVRTSQDF